MSEDPWASSQMNSDPISSDGNGELPDLSSDQVDAEDGKIGDREEFPCLSCGSFFRSRTLCDQHVAENRCVDERAEVIMEEMKITRQHKLDLKNQGFVECGNESFETKSQVDDHIKLCHQQVTKTKNYLGQGNL